MNFFQPRTALRYFLPLAIIGVAAVALLPGDQNAKPAATLVADVPARPSYLVDVPELQTDDIATAGIASLSVAPAAPAQELPKPLTTAAVSTTGEFPMDVAPEATAALSVEPSLPVGEANARVASAVNMRAGPSTSTQTLAVLKAGEPLHVIETNNGWVNVALADGSTGWVFSRYVAGPGFAPQEQASAPRMVEVDRDDDEPLSNRGVRLANDVALRAGPGRGSQRLFRVDEGEAVSVVEQRGDWVRISVGGGPSGWVRRSDLARR